MKSPLRILLLEDDPGDAELIQALLEADHFICDVTRVDARAEFVTALETIEADLILADYKLPSFDGISALKLAQSARPDLPFIFVSGSLGEEVAIEALKIGATDYVLKTRLTRLVPSVQRALREARETAERKKAEEALRRSELYLAEAQRLSHTGSFGWDAVGEELYWSDETYRIFGYDPGTKPTLRMAIERTHPDDRTHLQQMIERASIDGKDFADERRLMMPDGSVKYIQVVGHRSAGGEPEKVRFVGAITDITQRKRAEEAARRSEKELRDVIEALPTLAFSTSRDGATVWVNPRWVEYTGLSAEETSEPGWIEAIHPDDRDTHFTKWRQSLEFGQPFENEARHRGAQGEYRWFLVRAVPLRDEQGEILRWYGTLTDIEDRKRAEQERERLRQLEADLAHINRVSMMGELAASLAHEIKQPIAGAVMHADACARRLRSDPPDMAKAGEALSMIVRDATRAAAIIDRVSSLYRRGGLEPELVDLNDPIREITVLLRETANRKSISIRTGLDLALPRTTADRVQLQQVLMNLMLNGIEAMKDDGGELTVTSERSEDGQVLISVRDLGVGLPVEDKERIFEAFFTTKPQGSGMGLSISRRIIESHGGRLWAKPNTGRGATFQFTLPVTTAGSTKPAASS